MEMNSEKVKIVERNSSNAEKGISEYRVRDA